ncbi:MAG TPA: N-acetylmuramoyl-L-alanine amidase [Geobacteraceae bacterium]
MLRPFLLIMMVIFALTCVSPRAYAEERETKSAQAEKGKKGKGVHKKEKVKKKKGKREAPLRRHAVAPAMEPLPKGPILVKEMRYWSNPDYTRIAVTLDREAHYEYHQIPQNKEGGVPSRLYIDIAGAKVSAGIKDLQIGDGLLKSARVGQYKPETARVVLDLDSIKDYKLFTFSDPFRIIIDVKGERRTEIAPLKETIQAPPPTPHIVKREKTEVKTGARAPFGKVRRIVIDPGHGGHDPGASGAGGTKEKDVVLQIGLKLARLLREEQGLDVVMTRSTDVFLELQERTAIANQVGADLFVSIHANAALNRVASGIETYYLNLAKTEKAAQLAAKENGTSLEKVSLLQAVLFDLMANYKLNDSAHLAEEVQKSLHRKVSASYAPVKNLGVKQGPFYVLVGATMPSILVETAFVTNEKEEGRLKDSDYQETTATGIADGIRAYIAALK